MVTISLQRKGQVLKEEYGQVRYDGSKVSFHGFSCVFVKYLQRGLRGTGRTVVKPEQGMDFSISLSARF
jgi:hypothetical protein